MYRKEIGELRKKGGREDHLANRHIHMHDLCSHLNQFDETQQCREHACMHWEMSTSGS